MRRLALKLPTVLQIEDSYIILFHKASVFELKHRVVHDDYRALMTLSRNPSNRIWALIDSSTNLLEPAKLFKHSSPFFIVDLVSPHSGHLEWLKKIPHGYFYMKPWSDSEVLQVYVDLVSAGSQHSHYLQAPTPHFELHRIPALVFAQDIWRIS